MYKAKIALAAVLTAFSFTAYGVHASNAAPVVEVISQRPSKINWKCSTTGHEYFELASCWAGCKGGQCRMIWKGL